jgi:hypothetical protein
MSKVPVDRATPQLDTTANPVKMVTTGTAAIAKINASANIAAAPDVQAAIIPWTAANTALDTNNKSKAAGKAAVALAETNQPILMRRWGVRKDAVMVAIAAYGDGSKDLVQTFVAVEEREPPPPAVVPVNLRAMKVNKPTIASVRWDPTPGARGYLLQHATNPADPTTYSAAISTPGARFHLPGQAPATMVYFRVLACDPALPNGQTAYTAWVGVAVMG